MRSSAMISLATLLAACGPPGTATPPNVAPSTTVPSSAGPAEEHEDCAAGGPSARGADRGRARARLGEAAAGVLTASSKTEAFRMKPDPAEREPSPATSDRVAGYLVAGPPRQVPPEIAKKVAALLLDDGTYDFAPRKSCRVDTLFGFRFSKDARSVEVAFELRGERVYVAIADEPSKGRAFSARFSPARAEVLDALRAAFDGDRDVPTR